MARKNRPSVDTAPLAAPAQEPAGVQQMGCLALVARMTWLVFGNLALVAAALYVLDIGTFSGADLAFWAIVVVLLVARYLDVNRFGGFTSDGKPATPAHWRSYAFKLLAVAGVLWGLAHAAGRAIG